MATETVVFMWDGAARAMLPLPSHEEQYQEFVHGRTYWFERCEYAKRSQREHNRFFARLHELHQNLREEYVDRFPTETHLRKWCLIKAAWRKEQIYVYSSHTDAVLASTMVGAANEYAVVLVEDNIVTVYTAVSQSELRMKDRRDFHASQDAVLAIAEQMVMNPVGLPALPPPRRTRQPRSAPREQKVITQRRKDAAGGAA